MASLNEFIFRVTLIIAIIATFCSISLGQNRLSHLYDSMSIEGSAQRFDCSGQLPMTDCNLITNASFAINNPVGTNPGAYIADPFQTNVNGWQPTHGSADLNKFGAPPLANINYASIGISDLDVYGAGGEGISTKIPRLVAGRKYALSFFLSTSLQQGLPPLDFSLNILLINCQNMFTGQSTIPTYPSQRQMIYCESFVNVINSIWRQVYVEFTAQDTYDMIWVLPNTIAPPPTDLRVSYINFAFPELIDVTDFTAGYVVNNENCSITIGSDRLNCSVTNAVFTWRDPANNIIYSGSDQQITLSSYNSGNYTLSMDVPGAIMSNNTCSVNSPNISASVHVSNTSPSIHINNATIQYLQRSSSGVNSITQNLSECNPNVLCYSFAGGEYFEFNGISSEVAGNIWEARLVTVPPYSLGNGQFEGNFNNTPIPYPYSGNYYSFSNTQTGHLEIIFPANEVFIIEIKLTNTILNETRVLLIKNVPYSGVSSGDYYCISTSPTYPNPHKIILGVDMPGYTYQWTFPTGMNILTPLNHVQIEWDDAGFNYTATPNPIATLHVSNIHGCADYDISLNIAPENCSSPGQRKFDDNLMEKVEKVGTILYPNPGYSIIKIVSDKPIREIEIKNINGELLKRSLNNNQQLSVADLKPGMYLMVIKFSDNTLEVKKFLKQ